MISIVSDGHDGPSRVLAGSHYLHGSRDAVLIEHLREAGQFSAVAGRYTVTTVRRFVTFNNHFIILSPMCDRFNGDFYSCNFGW